MPVVVFCAEQEIDDKDGHGGAGDGHDAVAEEQKAKHVIDFAEPDVIQNEEEFHEDGAKREDANQEHGRDGAKIGCWGRNLARNLVHADRWLNRLQCISGYLTRIKGKGNLQHA